MKRLIRLALSLFLGALAVLSIFGFLASFEPLELHIRIIWRVVYMVMFVASMAGLIRINLTGKNSSADK